MRKEKNLKSGKINKLNKNKIAWGLFFSSEILHSVSCYFRKKFFLHFLFYFFCVVRPFAIFSFERFVSVVSTFELIQVFIFIFFFFVSSGWLSFFLTSFLLFFLVLALSLFTIFFSTFLSVDRAVAVERERETQIPVNMNYYDLCFCIDWMEENCDNERSKHKMQWHR